MADCARQTIERGEAFLGIEFGSTRIKAILIDRRNKPIGSGSHQWENRLENNLWTYSLNDIEEGLQSCYRNLCDNVRKEHNVEIIRLAGLGISAMMHGYMAFSANGQLLVPFRTWRNTNTGPAAAELSKLFDFNIPLRWSIAHIYQAILDNEPHVAEIAYINTLAGYVHWRLTGRRVLGVGDASGMFPIDPATGGYDSGMAAKFDDLLRKTGIKKDITHLLPEVVPAGELAGELTFDGARLLDPSGSLLHGVPLCAPEGDAGTGMVATNAVRPSTGNVSAGTSSFSMIVLDKNLSKPYEEIDIVTTPDGKPVAMVHCNNCTSDLNAWVEIFRQSLSLFGTNPDVGEIFEKLYNEALKGEADCGGLLNYNFLSGEPIAGVKTGHPLFMRNADSKFSLANFMRALLLSSMACLAIGNDILFDKEGIKVEALMAHGGLFKTPVVGQRLLAAALNSKVCVMDTAGEGGAWGMALLASFAFNNPDRLALPDYLDEKVFTDTHKSVVEPNDEDVAGFRIFLDNYVKNLKTEKL